MPGRGIPAKEVVEGPPRRKHPILLRQTSFKALEEPVRFLGADTAGTIPRASAKSSSAASRSPARAASAMTRCLPAPANRRPASATKTG